VVVTFLFGVKCLPITRRFKADADKVFGWIVFRGFILLLLRNIIPAPLKRWSVIGTPPVKKGVVF